MKPGIYKEGRRRQTADPSLYQQMQELMNSRSMLFPILLVALGGCAHFQRAHKRQATLRNNIKTPTVSAAPSGPTGELVDRVVAVVGDSAVMQLDIEEAILGLQASGQQVPPVTDTAARNVLRRQVLDSKIDELVLLQAAERDTIKIDDTAVENAVNSEIAERQKNFGSDDAFQVALKRENLTLEQYRAMRTVEYRRGAIVQQFLGKKQRENRPPLVSESEVKAFFEEQKERIGKRPATITFGQAIVVPHPTDSARTSARKLADEILGKVRTGEDFVQLAKRYSDDPGSKEKGGDLGWFRREQMVPQFSTVAYAMRPGDISGVVETPFGFHIIKLEKVRAGERQARHILIQPKMTEADAARTKAVADSVAAKLTAGASVDSLGKVYKDPNEETRIGPYPKDKLPAPYKDLLQDSKAGDVVGPIELPGDIPGANKYAIVKVLNVADAGDYSLDDPAVRTQVRTQLQRQKIVQDIVKDLRKRTYVEVRL
jgi:peptidyl-prolyl cis-trans isomerase SurA